MGAIYTFKAYTCQHNYSYSSSYFIERLLTSLYCSNHHFQHLLKYVFIRKFYYTFINRLRNFHAFKNVHRLFFSNCLKPETQDCLPHPFGVLFKIISFNSVSPILIISFSLGKTCQYSLISTIKAG